MKISFTGLFIFCLLISTGQGQGQQWQPLGDGLNGAVYVLQWYNGQLYAGGSFTDAGGDADGDYLARWDGSHWHKVAPGLTGPVHAITISDSMIYVGGSFINVAGDPNADNIAAWDGNEWSALDHGLDGTVYTITNTSTSLYAGGAFTDHLALWNGSSWTRTPFTLNGNVYTILSGGYEIFVGGNFTDAGGDPDADLVAHWDFDSGWNHLAKGLHSSGYGGVRDMQFYNGELYIFGDYNDCAIGNGTSTIPYLLRWDGSESYSDVYGINECRWGSSLCIAGNYLYIGVYDFISVDAGIHRLNLDTHEWEYFTGGWVISNESSYGEVALATDGHNVYAGHSFTKINNIAANNVAALFGTTAYTDPLIRQNSLSVYPNPAQQRVGFSLGGEENPSYHIILYDLQGKIVLNTITSSRDLDLTSVPQGIYMLEVGSGKQWGMAKMVKTD
jgi:hypothetical protein